MGRALYRKYRSKKLSEVIGQDHITSTLANAFKSGKISHAYLLTGPRGVGKTSVARIIAHEANGFKYDESQYHLDIIEIDAASNRRIDEIRDLRDKVHIAPSIGKYKVYIIDEVHMLTKEAFNALLKTLEEPPEHVIFVLATTEAHKLPQTIISRTQRFTFKPIDNNQVTKHLRYIAGKEGISIDDSALELIAQHGDGSFRDSISLLDQVSSHSDKVTADNVRQLLGLAPDKAINSLLDAVAGQSVANVLRELEDLYLQGHSASKLAGQISEKLRASIISESPFLGGNTTKLLKELINIQASIFPERLLEITLLDAAGISGNTKPATNVKNTAPKPEAVTSKSVPSVKAVPTGGRAKVQPPASSTVNLNGKFSLNHWQAVLADIKKTHNTLYSILRMGEPHVNGNKLTLNFRFAFHHKQINESRNKQLISDVVKRHNSEAVEIITVLRPKREHAKPEPKAPDDNLNTISNIFGGAEVLDS